MVPFFEKMKQLLGIYMKGNPAVRMMRQYRRKFIEILPLLAYIDDKPIFEIERLGVEAFLRGGKEEELKVRTEYAAKQNSWQKEACDRGKQIETEAKAERKKQFKRMMEDI